VLDTSNTWNHGYELLKSQILEEGTLPELKEGFYIGDEIPKTHPYFVNKKLNSDPNMWPTPCSSLSVSDVEDFKTTALEYYARVCALAKDILKVLALTVDLEESWFDGNEFTQGAVATMRLMHYPTQPLDSLQKLSARIQTSAPSHCFFKSTSPDCRSMTKRRKSGWMWRLHLVLL
jgi:isopenicillin N synthase-like dioxygenase